MKLKRDVHVTWVTVKKEIIETSDGLDLKTSRNIERYVVSTYPIMIFFKNIITKIKSWLLVNTPDV